MHDGAAVHAITRPELAAPSPHSCFHSGGFAVRGSWHPEVPLLVGYIATRNEIAALLSLRTRAADCVVGWDAAPALFQVGAASRGQSGANVSPRSRSVRQRVNRHACAKRRARSC